MIHLEYSVSAPSHASGYPLSFVVDAGIVTLAVGGPGWGMYDLVSNCEEACCHAGSR